MFAAVRGLAVAVDQQHLHKSVSGCGYRSTTIKTAQQHNELGTGVPATRIESLSWALEYQQLKHKSQHNRT